MADANEIKERIITIRREKNLTQEELAQTAGVSKGTVSRWESGEIRTLRIDKIKRIASTYGYNPMWIMGYEQNKNPQTKKEMELKDEIYDLLSNMDEKQLQKLKKFIADYIM